MLDTIEEKKIKGILESYPQRLVLSNPRDKSYTFLKVVFRKIELKGRPTYQMEQLTDKQIFHENIEFDNLAEFVLERFPEIFFQMNVFFENEQWDYKVTKKGKLLSNHHVLKKEEITTQRIDRVSGLGQRCVVPGGQALAQHNRRKNYLLEEGTVIPPLVDLGIFTKEGKVVRSMYDKFKQINRFLELVEDVLKNDTDKDLHIIDFGCGKSYLTFILYYYLVEVKGYRVNMTGLDLKEDVIYRCNETAKKYGYAGLHFELGDINGYQTEKPVDMVVTLHACDTATDYALYNAITWKANIILSVPCCQKELNAQVQTEQLPLLTKYGIVRERMSALMTDAIRANVLEYCGYKTQLLEFVDFANSPKNILIRAVRNNISASKREKAKVEVFQLLEEFHAKQTLADLVLK